MTKDERLRALLADVAAHIGGACRDGCAHDGCNLRRRVDAALIEPTEMELAIAREVAYLCGAKIAPGGS